MELYEIDSYTVKSVKAFEHNEGRMFTGNLYFNGSKIAEFEEAGRGGPMNIWYINDEVRDDFMISAKFKEDCDYSETDAIAIENLCNDFLDRKDTMSRRKKATLVKASTAQGVCVMIHPHPYCDGMVKKIISDMGDDDFMILNEAFDIYPDGVSKTYREDS